jgi:Fatty acid hydroxylase superfamily
MAGRTTVRLMKTILSVFAWLGISGITSEMFGYLLHRLMHSGRIRILSQNHMKHHLLLYGPLDPQRPGSDYKDATVEAASVGNIGLEWVVPATVILGAATLVLNLLRVSFLYQLVFIAGTLGWSFFLFSYLHDRMHITGFWMENNKWLQTWFLSARRAHDIHHWALNRDGLMDRNFGIAFFGFDRICGTYTQERPEFNHEGYEAARKRFSELVSASQSDGPCAAKENPSHPQGGSLVRESLYFWN